MSLKKPKLVCPKCGALMNHHAEKLSYALDARQATFVDPALGGLVEEFHSCPKCGNGEARPSTLPSDA